jgi:integrase
LDVRRRGLAAILKSSRTPDNTDTSKSVQIGVSKVASITSDPSGRRRIQFVDANGKRKSIRLGKLPMRDAERVKTFVEHLVNSQTTKQPIDGETARWLAKIGDVLAAKLADVGLIRPRASAPLADFINGYIKGRTDLKPRTIIKFNATREYLVEFLGAERPLRDISPGDANNWRIHLVGKKLSENTIRKHAQIAKQFFTSAANDNLIESNPFAGLRSTVQSNPDRFYFVTREEAEKVLAACPDAEWQLIFALSRYGGLRCPSEHIALKWSDIDWEHGRIVVNSCKTEHHVGGKKRTIPMFRELRPYLEALHDKVRPGIDCPLSTPIITRYRDADQNLRSGLEDIIYRVGLTPWPKLFQNLRSTRQTELADEFPAHVVSDWIGNSKPVAAKHYLQVTDQHFKKAAQNPAQSVLGGAESDGLHSSDNAKTPRKSRGAKPGRLCTTGKIAETAIWSIPMKRSHISAARACRTLCARKSTWVRGPSL